MGAKKKNIFFPKPDQNYFWKLSGTIELCVWNTLKWFLCDMLGFFWKLAYHKFNISSRFFSGKTTELFLKSIRNYRTIVHAKGTLKKSWYANTWYAKFTETSGRITLRWVYARRPEHEPNTNSFDVDRLTSLDWAVFIGSFALGSCSARARLA